MDLRTRDITDLLGRGVNYALTLWPEWICKFTLFDADVENRKWAPPRELIGQRIALHSGAHIGGRKGATAMVEGIQAFGGQAEEAGWAPTGVGPGWIEFEKLDRTVRLELDKIATRAITCTGLLVDVTSPSRPRPGDGWYVGTYGWRFREIERLPTPIACSGAQGLWRIGGLL